ncbi:MAG: alpha/beta fold hydrolase [Mycoplasmoidaceae bacterium]
MKNINIIFIHGLVANKDSNKALKNYCEKNKFNYYSLDLPGHGKEPFGDIDINLNSYIDFVLNFIKTNKIKKPILVGHSFGGAIIVGLISQMKKEDKYLAILEDPINPSILQGIDPNKIDKKLFDIALFTKKLKEMSKYKFDDFKKIIILLTNTTSEKTLLLLSVWYKKIDIPTLVIFGKNDRLINQEASFKTIKKLNKEIEFSLIEKARHTPHDEDPENYIKSLNEFLIKNKVIK